MATQTTHYNLTKQAYVERADVAVINENMDSIDSALYGKMDKPSNYGVRDQILRNDGEGGAVWGEAAGTTEIQEAVQDWLDENIPSGHAIAVDNTLSTSGAAAEAVAAGSVVVVGNSQPSHQVNKIWIKENAEEEITVPTYTEFQQAKSSMEVLEPAATASDIGKALIAKTVSGGKVTSYEFGKAGGVDIDDTAGVGTTDKTWSANKIANSLTGTVHYDSAQSLTSAQKTQARSNIGAVTSSDIEDGIQNLVQSVTETEGTVVITKKSGTQTSFEIPQGLAFDGGYVDQSDNTLHLTMNGNDIEGYDPIILTSGGPSDVDYDANYYLHFYDANGDEMYDGPFLIEGGGGGGGTVVSSIALSDVVKTNAVRNGADAIFSFTATSSDDTDITAKWYVDNVLVTTSEYFSGSTFQFNAKGRLKNSSTSIVKVALTSEGGASLTRTWMVTSTAFSITWGAAINPIMLYTSNENIYVVVNIAAQAGTDNVLTVSVGNHDEERTVTGSRSVTIELNKSWFATGVNTVTAIMASASDSTDTTDEIAFTAIWGYGATSPIVAFADETIRGTQYDTIPIRYFAYNPSGETATCTIQIGSEQPRSIIADRTIHTLSYVPQNQGTFIVRLTCGTSSDTMTMIVAESEYDIGMVKGDSLRYNLDPVGHTNSDADREDFADLTFSQGFDWVNGGFQKDDNGADAFVVKKGHRATLPRSLFADGDGNGKVIDVSFKIVNSDQYDAVAMQDLNNSTTKGLILRANEGELRLDNVSGQVFRYCEDSRVDVSVHVEEITNQRLVTIWLDGIPSKVDAYEAGTLVHSENAMVIGSDHCDVWVYAIHVYNAVLSEKEMIQNYISMGINTDDKIDRYNKNNIFDANNVITPAMLHAAMPNLTIVELECERMTVNKKDNVPANVTITDGSTKLILQAASSPSSNDGAFFKVQGTSSAAYGRSSYNLDIDFSGTGETYKISSSSIPVNYLNVKVNVASSENANNVNGVDWYNTYQPYKIEADSTAGKRDVIEAKPCAVFIKNTSNTAVWFSSQLVQPDETILYAMGDLCNSKKNLAVFGEDGVGTHPTLACIEVSGNDTEPERFVTDQGFEYRSSEGEWQSFDGYDDQGNEKWITHYEWRMEPSNDNLSTVVQAWDDAVSWVVSTIGNSTKFKNEVGNYFAINSLLYHFLMIEFFAAYDNVSKNTFYSYDYDTTAHKYLWNIKKAYDWDTILAADNDGKPFGDYGIDYGDTIDGTVNGRSYFNAVDNTIWANIKAAFQPELSAMYISLRSQGAWDANGVIEKWDNYQSRRPHAAMVHDAYIKYIYPYKTFGMVIDGETKSYDDSYLPRMQGSKTYWRRQFMTYQTAYMDGKYGYYSTSNAIAFRTNCESGHEDFVVKVYAKTYITALADANKVASQKIATGGTATFTNVSVGSNTTIYFTPARLVEYIRPLNQTDNSTFVASGATKLMEANLGSENVNSAWLSGTGLNIPSAILKDLSIRNMVNFSSALNLAGNAELETLDTRGTNTGRITLPAYGPITSLKLNACTGIVAMNLNSITDFSMESGDNLISVRVENCNALLMNAMRGYLEDAESSIEFLRLIGVNWTLSDTSLLNKLLNVGSISDSGGTGPAPCVITGNVYVPAIRNGELAAYTEAWPDLTITYSQLISQHAVTFLNWDNSPILDTSGHAYVQYVDAGSAAHDPILSGEVNTPTRVSDDQYVYTYSGWDNIPSSVIGNETVHATYSHTNVTYTVQYYDGIGSVDGTLIEEITNLAYGSSCAPTNPIPTYTSMEGNNIYYVFNGWDKCTGYIKPETGSLTPNIIKVHARWITGGLPSTSSNPGLNAMNWAQRYAVAKTKQASTYWELGESMEFTLGHGDDFNFNNVASETLVSTPTWFGGNNVMIFNGQNGRPSIQLFNNSIDRWTLAIDFEAVGDSGSLVSCFSDNGNLGFNLRRTGNYTNVIWGNTNNNVNYKYLRGMVVFRYNKDNPSILYMTYDGNTEQMRYPISLDTPANCVKSLGMYRNTTAYTTSPLTFGGIGYMDGSDIVSLRCNGWIHWAKIWYDDIGLDNAKAMCAMPHIPAKYFYTGIQYRDGLDSVNVVGAGFQSDAPLPLRGVISLSYSNVGGWRDSAARPWLNDQYFKGLPIPLQSIICEARVKSTAGGGESNIPNTDIVYSMDKIYLPAYAELFSYVTGAGYVDELDDMNHRMPGFVFDRSKGQTNDGNTRMRWNGFIIPEDTNFIMGISTDPTTPGLDYTVRSGKTIWGQYLYVDADTASKHNFYAGRHFSETSSVLNAAGADSDGHTGGKWIMADSWWSRSPYTTSGTMWNYTSSSGGSGGSSTSSYGIMPAFSI